MLILISFTSSLWFFLHKFTCLMEDTYPLLTGRCTVYKDETEELPFTADHMLALPSENSVRANVQEPIRIVAVSVPRDPSMSPMPLFRKSLSEVIDSDRNVSFERGYSRRFLAAPDGFNISFHNTLCLSHFNKHLQYVNNAEVVYFIKGQGEYIWENGQQQQEFDSEKDHGTLFLTAHDAHEVKIGASDSIAICLFFPPLKGNERLKADGSSYWFLAILEFLNRRGLGTRTIFVPRPRRLTGLRYLNGSGDENSSWQDLFDINNKREYCVRGTDVKHFLTNVMLEHPRTA